MSRIVQNIADSVERIVTPVMMRFNNKREGEVAIKPCEDI